MSEVTAPKTIPATLLDFFVVLLASLHRRARWETFSDFAVRRIFRLKVAALETAVD